MLVFLQCSLVTKIIYHEKKNDPDVQAGGGDSPFGRPFVSSGHKLLRALDIWSADDGREISFWNIDRWLDGYGPLKNLAESEIPEASLHYTVVDMVQDDNKWRWGLFVHLLPMQVASYPLPGMSNLWSRSGSWYGGVRNGPDQDIFRVIF